MTACTPVQIGASGAKYLIACGFFPESSQLLSALSRASLLQPLHGVFMTVAPSDIAWVQQALPDSRYTFSPGQWHHTAKPRPSALVPDDAPPLTPRTQTTRRCAP